MTLDLIRLSWRNLFASPVRSCLTVMGLGIGIGAIIAVLSVGKNGRAEIEAQLNQLGINRVWVTAEAAQPLTREDAKVIGGALPGALVSPARTGLSQVEAYGKTANVQLIGCEKQKLDIDEVRLTAGGFFAGEDGLARVAVLDDAVCGLLGGVKIGESVKVGGQAFVVSGIAQAAQLPMLGGNAVGGRVWIPMRAYESALGAGPLDEITVASPGAPEQTAALIRRVLELKRGGAGERDGLRVSTMQQEAQVAYRVINIFLLVVLCVAGVCTLTGCIGVMNILLVSVRERRREIGVLKAIGARAADIRNQFLIESFGYSLGGCVLGLAFGTAFTALASGWIGLRFAISVDDVLASVLVTCAVGIACGVWPASRAAALSPLEALKAQ